MNLTVEKMPEISSKRFVVITKKYCLCCIKIMRSIKRLYNGLCRFINKDKYITGGINLSIYNSSCMSSDSTYSINIVRSNNTKYGCVVRNLENNKPSIQPIQNTLEAVILVTYDKNYKYAHNHLLSPDNKVIYERNISYKQLSIYDKPLPRKYNHVNGTIAYLSNTHPTNYGHWLLYTLPMLEYYNKYVGKENINYYYIGSTIVNFQLESLLYWGIQRQQIIAIPTTADKIVSCVINRNVHDNGYTYPSIYAYNYVRSNIISNLCNTNKTPERIYVLRGSTPYRQVTNSADVVEYLQSIGFTAISMDGLSLYEQASMFYNAKAIISTWGAAMTNMIFLEPNTTVIEICPSDYSDGFFYALASYTGAEYYYMLSDKSIDDNRDSRKANINIDISKLRKICKIAKLDVN